MNQLLRILFTLLMLAAGVLATYELYDAYTLHAAADMLFRVQVAIALYLAALWTGTFMSVLPALLPVRTPPTQ